MKMNKLATVLAILGVIFVAQVSAFDNSASDLVRNKRTIHFFINNLASLFAPEQAAGAKQYQPLRNTIFSSSGHLSGQVGGTTAKPFMQASLPENADMSSERLTNLRFDAPTSSGPSRVPLMPTTMAPEPSTTEATTTTTQATTTTTETPTTTTEATTTSTESPTTSAAPESTTQFIIDVDTTMAEIVPDTTVSNLEISASSATPEIESKSDNLVNAFDGNAPQTFAIMSRFSNDEPAGIPSYQNTYNPFPYNNNYMNLQYQQQLPYVQQQQQQQQIQHQQLYQQQPISNVDQQNYIQYNPSQGHSQSRVKMHDNMYDLVTYHNMPHNPQTGYNVQAFGRNNYY